jgi:hypothetical protein
MVRILDYGGVWVFGVWFKIVCKVGGLRVWDLGLKVWGLRFRNYGHN